EVGPLRQIGLAEDHRAARAQFRGHSGVLQSRHADQCERPCGGLHLVNGGEHGGADDSNRDVVITATTCSALGKPTNESVFHRCWRLSCQLNLVGVAPSVPILPLSAQHIRGPVVVEIPRSSAAAGGHSPRWHKSWSGLGWKGRTLVFLAAYRARPALFCCGQP